MTDKNKAIHRYISANGPEKGCYSFAHASDARRKALKKVPATNDNAESSLASTTRQIQAYGRIAINHAAVVSDMRRNRWLQRSTMGERKKKKLKREAGLFHDFPEVVQVAIIQSAIDDAAEQQKRNNDKLEAHTERQRKARKN